VVVLYAGVPGHFATARRWSFIIGRIKVTKAQADDRAGAGKQRLWVCAAPDTGLGVPGQAAHLPGFDPRQSGVPVSDELIGSGDPHQVETALYGVFGNLSFQVLHGLR
jgi:hypothetical protein